MKKIAFIFFILFGYQLHGQDSLLVMYHNVLNFPGVTPERVDSIRQVLQFAKPDVYVVNELESAYGADLILNDALNVFGETKYQRATFINGPDTDNGFFYNSTKLGLISQDQIGTSLRDISVYKMYYKAPNLHAQTDTIYFYFFSCHLKAGSTEYNQRNLEAKQLKFYLNSIANEVENVFVGGDFNFYSGYESGCLTIKNEGQVVLNDPIDATGNWSNNFSFAQTHTQSTRNSSGVGGDGSGGGLDDRFDLIFVSDDVLDNSNGVNYLSGSYKALGQDGNRYNSSVISPSNTAVPDSVANALYWASDHLPVMMKVVLDETASIGAKKNEPDIRFDKEKRALLLNISAEQKELSLYNLSGQLVHTTHSMDKMVTLPQNLKAGLYLWKVVLDGAIYTGKVVLD